MSKVIKVFLKKGKEQSLQRFHPWVFSGAIDDKRTHKQAPDFEAYNGEIAEVYTSSGEFLGVGHFSVGTIMVRILSFEKKEINSEFWLEAIGKALQMRERTLLSTSSNTNCYRLVHGEGDNLPGLIIDIYGEVAVIQPHTLGMEKSLSEISNALQTLLGSSCKAIYCKGTATSKSQVLSNISDGYLKTPENKLDNVVLENGVKFYVDWEKGQKTGFFLDQRDNRALVKEYAKDKRVLNLFCYTGGFSLYALSGGAKFADSVDSSAFAIESVKNNLKLNGFASGEKYGENRAICTDAIDFLREVKKDDYDLMIVDPPAFAKHLSAKRNALRAYKNLNALAIEKVSSGGLIFTFSCSQVVDKYDFALALFSAAAQAHRKVRILGRLTQPLDHPVNIYHPEGEYLKGLLLYVE